MTRSIQRQPARGLARGKTATLTATVALLLAAMPALATPPTYTVTFLGTFGDSIQGYGINNNGQVVGAARTPGVSMPFAFVSDGATSTRAISSPPGAVAMGTDINNHGIMAGGLAIGPFKTGILYDTATDTVLASAPSVQGDQVLGLKINDNGQAGGTTQATGKNQAFFYDGATLRGLGTLGGERSTGFGLNNLGHVVGQAETSTGELHGFFHDGATMQDIGSLGGIVTKANDINDSDQIVGRSQTSTGATHAFLHDNTGMHDLGALAAGEASEALAINNPGQVVGKSQGRAFLHDGTAMYALSDLVDAADPYKGLEFAEARAINDKGEIVVNGCYPVDGYLTFLLKPKASPLIISSEGAGDYSFWYSSGAITSMTMAVIPEPTIITIADPN